MFWIWCEWRMPSYPNYFKNVGKIYLDIGSLDEYELYFEVLILKKNIGIDDY